MGILLNDEEILGAQGINKTCDDNSHRIAKAQLKKVVECFGEVEYLIDDYGEWGHCRQGWEDTNATHVAIPYKCWQALLKEVE